MGDALYDNFAIWRWNDIYTYWPSLPLVDGPDAEYDNLRAWLPARTAWIDANIDAW